MGKPTKKEEFNKYQMFHIHRIMSVLMEAEHPKNDHRGDGKSENGTFLFYGWEESRQQIISSMFELGYFSADEYDKIKEIMDEKPPTFKLSSVTGGK